MEPIPQGHKCARFEDEPETIKTNLIGHSDPLSGPQAMEFNEACRKFLAKRNALCSWDRIDFTNRDIDNEEKTDA